jgi:hypothetical protein
MDGDWKEIVINENLGIILGNKTQRHYKHIGKPSSSIRTVKGLPKSLFSNPILHLRAICISSLNTIFLFFMDN